MNQNFASLTSSQSITNYIIHKKLKKLTKKKQRKLKCKQKYVQFRLFSPPIYQNVCLILTTKIILD